MWISYYRCGQCGRVRQYGATTEKLPPTPGPLLKCEECPKPAGHGHIRHAHVITEPLTPVRRRYDPNSNENCAEVIERRCGELRETRQVA